MQQVHRFVCSVATGVEEATPLPAAATGGVPGSLMRLRLGKRHPFPLPRLAIGRGGMTKIFLPFSLKGVSPRLWMPLAGHRKGSICRSWGVASTLAYPVVFEALVGRFRGGV